MPSASKAGIVAAGTLAAATNIIFPDEDRATGARGVDQFQFRRQERRRAWSPNPVAASQKPACSPQGDRKEQKRTEAAQRQARSNKKSEIQKRIAAMEKKSLRGTGNEGKELTAELEKPESYAGGRAMQTQPRVVTRPRPAAGSDTRRGASVAGTGTVWELMADFTQSFHPAFFPTPRLFSTDPAGVEPQ